jgi:hypothetical protein
VTSFAEQVAHLEIEQQLELLRWALDRYTLKAGLPQSDLTPLYLVLAEEIRTRIAELASAEDSSSPPRVLEI